MAYTVNYGLDTLAQAETDCDFTDPVGVGLQVNNTGRRWCWHNGGTTSAGVGPEGPQAGAGYVYTEMSSGGANSDVFTMTVTPVFDTTTGTTEASVWWGYRGDGNNGTLQLQSRTGAGAWTTRSTVVLDSQGIPQNSPFVWVELTADVTAENSVNTQIQLIVTQGTAGTTWHKDVGIDSVQIVNTDPPVGGTAYSDAVLALNADHHWPFDNNTTDIISASNGTNAGMALASAPIAMDVTNSAQSDGRTDRMTFPSLATINNAAHTRKAMSVWFMIDTIDQPFTRIYGEGNQTQTFQFVLGMGNRVTFEARSGATWQVQVYTDRALAPNRPYHLYAAIEGNGFGNSADFYLDGVLQTTAIPVDRQPGSASLAARAAVGNIADPAGTVGLNGTILLEVAPINGSFNHLIAWSNKALPSATDVRETLFELGGLADFTITSGTEAVMQAQLDSIASTVRPDWPIAIRVEANTGDTDFVLNADNVTFDPLASVHVQYMGDSVLTWRNANGANASIGSTPGAGSISFVTAVALTVTARDAVAPFPIVPGARVRLLADTGGPAPAGTVIMNGIVDGVGQLTGDYDYMGDQPVTGWVRNHTLILAQGALSGTITEAGLDITGLLIPDDN